MLIFFGEGTFPVIQALWGFSKKSFQKITPPLYTENHGVMSIKIECEDVYNLFHLCKQLRNNKEKELNVKPIAKQKSEQ